MASPKRKTRDELIQTGFCPSCSKYVAFLFKMESSGTMFHCRKCGTLLLEVYRPEDRPDLRPPAERQQFFDNGGNPIPYQEERMVFDVTGRWDEIRDWFVPRRDDIDVKQAELADKYKAEKYDLERQLRSEMCRMLSVLLNSENLPKNGLTLVKR